MSQPATTHHNHHRSPSSNNYNHNNLHQQLPPIIKLETDDEDDDVVYLETVQKTLPTLTPVCLVKTSGQLDYHDECLCVKCRLIKDFLADKFKFECEPDCAECSKADSRQGDRNSNCSTPEENEKMDQNEDTNDESLNFEANITMPSISSTATNKKKMMNKSKKTSTNLSEFKCGHCSKSFPTKYRLTVHVFTHSGKKPFKCSRCMMTFNRDSNCAKHYRTVHQEKKLFRCAFNGCDYAEPKYSDVTGHIQIAHRDACKSGHMKTVFKEKVERCYLAPNRE